MASKRISPAAAVLLALITSACGRAEPAVETPPPPLVEAVQARSGALPLQATVYGVVRADNQVEVRSEIAAQVAEVLVRSGASVERGQLLVRLEDDDPQEQLRRAEAEVRLAEAEAEGTEARLAELETRSARVRRLAEDDLVSEQERETLDAQLEGARAASRAATARVQQVRATVEERRTALSRTRVRSPVTGRVGERRAEIGMRVDPSTVLFRVGNLDRVTVDVTLSESLSAVIEPGHEARVELPGTEGKAWIEGRVARISPFLDARSFTTVAEIELDNADGRLRPGMFVDVTVYYGRSDEATLIPLSALWEDPRSGERGVFVVQETQDIDDPDRSRRVSWSRVLVLAEGEGVVGVDRVHPEQWVVVTGQHLLHRSLIDAAAESTTATPVDGVAARIRPATWDRITTLQGMQREDLLETFLDKQRRIARALGAEIPESETEVERALASPDR